MPAQQAVARGLGRHAQQRGDIGVGGAGRGLSCRDGGELLVRVMATWRRCLAVPRQASTVLMDELEPLQLVGFCESREGDSFRIGRENEQKSRLSSMERNIELGEWFRRPYR